MIRSILIGGVLALALLAGRARGGTVPFILPWDDATPGVTDSPGLNQVIGADSRAKSMSDMRVRPLFSSDLASWIPSPRESDPATVQDAGRSEWVTPTSCQSASSCDPVYGRLFIERLNP